MKIRRLGLTTFTRRTVLLELLDVDFSCRSVLRDLLDVGFISFVVLVEDFGSVELLGDGECTLHNIHLDVVGVERRIAA